MIKKITLLVFVVLSVNLSAQQDEHFTMYMFNLYQVNSAYVGTRETLFLTAMARTQWTGIDGAPTMQSFTANIPFSSKNIGLGFLAVNQNAGAHGSTRIMATFGYHFRLGNGHLSFGASAGTINNRFNWGKATFKDLADQVQSSGVENTYTANFNFASYFYTNTLYVGIQFDNINQSEFSTVPDGKSRNYLNFNAVIGKAFVLSKNVVFKPSALGRVTKSAFLAELNLSFLFKEVFWAGISVRSNSELSLILEVNIARRFRIGYSYDYGFGALNSFNSGSHELFLGYDIRINNRNMASPRYF